MENIIQLKNVSFAYSGEPAPVWQGLNCFFRKNEINLILGPSGCGKSTLLYLLNGLIPHSFEGDADGEVLFQGENVLEKKPMEMAPHIGMVFQDPETQFCTFTVEDELAFGLENMETPAERIDKAISRALAMVGMEDFRKRLLSELSGGQKQKIAIASVLVMEADILVFDEPTANLDAESQEDIFRLIRRLVDEYGKTVIMVEHNLDGLMEMAGNILVLDEYGKIRLSGCAREVITRLVYDEACSDLNVFLPETLLVMREWLAACRQNPLAVSYCEEQLQKPADMEKHFYRPEPDALAGLLLKFPHRDRPDTMSHEADDREEILSIKNLTYRYPAPGKRRRKRRENESAAPCVLKGVSLSVRKGDFIAVLGPNGVGKSTLLNVIFRVFEDYSGSITVEGRELSAIPKQELYRKFGLVFQNPEWQFVTNEVYDELMFSLKKSDLSEEEKKAKADEMLARFHLTELKNQSPFLLSQGQKRRLSVAAMLLTGQKVLFLDEPTYGQDYENQAELMELMRQLNREGVTIIVVTHDMSLVAEYAKKVFLLADGRTVCEETPEGLFAQPDLVKLGRLKCPETLNFTRELRNRVPDMPLFISKERLIRYLIERTCKEE